MKPEEIMVGDWIMFPNSIEKVQEVSFVEGKGYCASFAASATLFPISIDLLKPIPITSEILEKNGFVKRSDRDDKLGKMEYYQFEDYGFVYHYSDGEWEFSLQNTQDHRLFSGYLNYVHEFQHALRLCKIDKEITL